MSDRLLKESDVIEAFKGREPLIHDVYTATAIIRSVPSADRPQGEWIGEADGYYNGELVYDTWYCSNCDYAVDDEEPPTWNYCPNCGARMKGVE